MTSERPRRRNANRTILRLLLLIGLVGAVHYYFVGPRPMLVPADDTYSGARTRRFDALTGLERRQLSEQRARVAELARRHVGSVPTGGRGDLRILQQLIDQNAVAPDETRELQALGVVLGDVMADRLGLDWVAYQDELGRSRALRLGETDVVIFPVTMIAKRVEAGIPCDVEDLWARAEGVVRGARHTARR